MADKNIKTLKRGLLIIIEGIDGAGKTTQVKLLAEHLRKLGYLVSTLLSYLYTPRHKKVRPFLDAASLLVLDCLKITDFRNRT